MFQKLYQNRRSYFMSDFSHFHYFFWKACYWHKLLKLIVGWNQVFSLTWEFFERFLSEIVAVWIFQNLYQNGRSYFLSDISQFYLFFLKHLLLTKTCEIDSWLKSGLWPCSEIFWEIFVGNCGYLDVSKSLPKRSELLHEWFFPIFIIFFWNTWHW